MRFWQFFRREFASAKGQLSLFLTCVALAILSVTALGAFQGSIQDSVAADAKELSGGDITVRSNQPFLPDLENALQQILRSPGNTQSRLLSFSTIAYAPEPDTSLFVNLQAVDTAYPLYGQVVTGSGAPLRELLIPGQILVEQNILERLGVAIGDSIKVGTENFIAADTIRERPDDSGNVFTAGQTVLMLLDDAEKTGLVGARSRISYEAYVRLDDPTQAEAVAATLKQAAGPRERVRSFQETRTRTERFLDQFFSFLHFTSLFTMLLAGIGMMSTLTAYFKRRANTVAILKTLGLTSREVLSFFLRFVAVFSLLGIGLGILLAVGTFAYLPTLFAGLLPEGFAPHWEWSAVLQAVVIGLTVSGIFTALPLRQLKEITPVQVFRKQEEAQRGNYRKSIVLYGAMFLIFTLLAWLNIGEVSLTMYFVLGSLVLFLILFACSELFFLLLKKSITKTRLLSFTLALKGLLRPGNSSRLIITALSTAFAVLLSIPLLQNNIIQQFVRSYPENYPNVFFLDIQRDQRDGLKDILGENSSFYPVIRASLLKHNDTPITEATQQNIGERNDDVTRSFNLTYGVELSENETIVATREPGKILLNNYDNPKITQVSVLKEFGDLLNMQLGDRLVFSIQGVELPAEIVSIRERKEQRIEPFFYFIFEEKVLADFPQTLFTTAKIAPEKIAATQNAVVKAYPNITTVDMTMIIAKTTELLAKLTAIIRFFTFFSLAAGILLLVSSLFATSAERVREMVYYKLLGLRRSQVARITLLEFLLITLVVSCLGILFSHLGVALLLIHVLDISFVFFWNTVGIFVLGLMLLVFLVASVFLFPLLRTRPVDYLRENAVE